MSQRILRIAAACALFLAGRSVLAQDCNTRLAESAYVLCSACHALTADEPQREGPHLQGIYGRKAASLPGFPYSDALRKSGWTWTKELLDRFLASPQRALPGTSMTFVGLKSAAEREALLCYLERARAPSAKTAKRAAAGPGQSRPLADVQTRTLSSLETTRHPHEAARAQHHDSM